MFVLRSCLEITTKRLVGTKTSPLMALPMPLFFGATAGLMFAAQSIKDKPQPVAHFRKLHEQNIKAFQHRLTVIAQSLESKDIDLRIDLRNDTSHDELHDLLHRYSRYFRVSPIDSTNNGESQLKP